METGETGEEFIPYQRPDMRGNGYYRPIDCFAPSACGLLSGLGELLMPEIKIELRDASDPEALRIEYEVFLDAGYISQNEFGRAVEYDKYPSSRFLVALVDGETAGVVRLISDSTGPVEKMNLPTLKDFEIWPSAYETLRRYSPHEILELGTLAIVKKYRGTEVIRELSLSIISECLDCKIRCAIACIDEHFYKALARRRLPFRQIGDARLYLGSMTVPGLFNYKIFAHIYLAVGRLMRRIKK